MAELKYPRFNTIYSNRNEAVEKLNELSRSYGEPVAIRYYNKSKAICVLLAIYKSESRGDYSINYDSNPEMAPRVYTATKEDSNTSDEECINVAIFGKMPVLNDIVILTDLSKEIPSTRSYIYSDGWKLLSNTGSGLGSGSLEIGDSLVPVMNEDGTANLEVRVDNSTIKYDEKTGGLTVTSLNGGTF